MAFVFGIVSFVLGSALIAICLAAIPGPGGAAGAHEHEAGGHGHGGH
jgi:hypothetical protein